MRKRRLHMSSMTTNRDRSDVCLSILITFREKFNLYLAGINGAWESNENTTIARRSTQRNSWDRRHCCVHSIGFFFLDRRMQMQSQRKPRSHDTSPYQMAAEQNVNGKHQTQIVLAWIRRDKMKNLEKWYVTRMEWDLYDDKIGSTES